MFYAKQLSSVVRIQVCALVLCTVPGLNGSAQATGAECDAAATPLHDASFNSCGARGGKTRALYLEAKGAGTYRVARSLLRYAHAICPSSSVVTNGWIQLDIDHGEYDEASSLIDGELGKHESPGLHAFKYAIEMARNNYKLAAAEAQIAAQACESESNIFDFGSALAKLDYHSADQIFAYGVAKYPQSVRLRVGMAGVTILERHYFDGIRLLVDASKLDPRDPAPMELLTEFQFVPLDLNDDVEERFEDLRRRYPGNGKIAFGLCMVKYKRWNGQDEWAAVGDTSPEFQSCIRSAIDRDPNLPAAWYQIALADRESGRPQAELEALKKAVALSPNNEVYRYHLAMIYRDLGNKQAFNEEMKEFEELHRSAK